MTDSITQMISLLKSSKQLILTGAPGTGKTYKAEQIAASLILEDNENPHKTLQDVLEAVAKGTAATEQNDIAAHYEFVQFHPGYDYSDFVEGLKPDIENGQVVFRRTPGTFMEFCNKAGKTSASQEGYDKAGKTSAIQKLEAACQKLYEECVANKGKISLKTKQGNDFKIKIKSKRKKFKDKEDDISYDYDI